MFHSWKAKKNLGNTNSSTSQVKTSTLSRYFYLSLQITTCQFIRLHISFLAIIKNWMWTCFCNVLRFLFLRQSFQTLSLRTGKKGFFFSFCWLCAISSWKQKSGRDMMTLSILCCLAKAAFVNFLKPMGDTPCNYFIRTLFWKIWLQID